jgi:hypothetical protein
MKKFILLISLLSLVACTPPMKSEPNKCKCTPGHCCADTVTVKENFSLPTQNFKLKKMLLLKNSSHTHNYEEIPSNHEEIL